MTLPVLDWAHAAYEAARRRDLESVLGALQPLVRDGRRAVDVAMRAWIDRTLIVMHAVMHQSNTQPGPALEMENARTGDVTPINEVPEESAWAGRMFMAHANHDRDMWDILWSAVPADPEAITDHVMALLQATTATAEAYAAQSHPDLACCPMHANPMLAATRAAMAHYN